MSSATKAAAGNVRIDVDGYRARVVDAVGIAADELSAQGRDNPQLVMTRMVAAYFLFARDHLLVSISRES